MRLKVSPMRLGNLQYITPPDGLAEGETVLRDRPLVGFFAIRTAKGGLERGLAVTTAVNHYLYSIFLDGFLLAPPNKDWRTAFGWLADKGKFVLGRRVSVAEYNQLLKLRALDKERGIDISASVNLNDVEIPTFGVKK